VRVPDAWTVSQRVADLACLLQIRAKIRLLYGAEPFPFQTLNFRVGSEQETHSDAMHFHSFPARMMCGVWVALEDVDETNGPLHYYPGSHTLPVYTFAELGVPVQGTPNDYGLYSAIYVPFIQKLIAAHGLKKSVLTVRKGQALIWAANLLHGGEPIRDPGRTRFTQVTHYFFEGCDYYTPMWSDLARGDIFRRTPYNIVTRSSIPLRDAPVAAPAEPEPVVRPSTPRRAAAQARAPWWKRLSRLDGRKAG
jgi:hypothetical protein